MALNVSETASTLDRRLIEDRCLAAHRSRNREAGVYGAQRGVETFRPRIPTAVIVLALAAMVACAIWMVLHQ